MHYEILDENRQKLLPLFDMFYDSFYLAGGTALALQINHRESIDFDFFSPSEFSTKELFDKIQINFFGHTIRKIQDEKNTLSVVIDSVKVSFLTYQYPLAESLLNETHFRVASVLDIGCMKLSAITSRSVLKDFVDLYFILKQYSLSTLLATIEKVTPALDHAIVLKSLIYFDDVTIEPILFTKESEVNFDVIKEYLLSRVKEYIKAG